jgi:hypothetical protein
MGVPHLGQGKVTLPTSFAMLLLVDVHFVSIYDWQKDLFLKVFIIELCPKSHKKVYCQSMRTILFYHKKS